MKLYDFQNGALDQYLGHLIGNTREAKAMQVVRRNVEIIRTQNITSQHIRVKSDGVFIEKGNIPYRTYLYLGRYNVQDYGLPKKHYFACETVQQYTSFIATNQEQVDVFCNQTFQTYSGVVLDLCRYCKRIFSEKTAQLIIGESFDEFILMMTSLPQNPPLPVDSVIRSIFLKSARPFGG